MPLRQIDLAMELDLLDDPTDVTLATLDRAKDWLKKAVAEDDLDRIVEIKLQGVSLGAYIRERRLGADAALSAAEIVRRAEYALGTVARARANSNRLPEEYFGSRRERDEATVLLRANPEQFECVLAEVRAMGDMTRASVVRKIKEVATGTATSSARRRRPMPETVRDAVYNALRTAEVVGRLTGDERLASNVSKIDPLTRNNLRRAINVLTTFAASINVDHLEEK